MNHNTQDQLRKASERTQQARCLLTLLQRTNFDNAKNSAGDTIIDEAVITCALEGITDLLNEAIDMQINMIVDLREEGAQS